jgi:hypothetical protein
LGAEASSFSKTGDKAQKKYFFNSIGCLSKFLASIFYLRSIFATLLTDLKINIKFCFLAALSIKKKIFIIPHFHFGEF